MSSREKQPQDPVVLELKKRIAELEANDRFRLVVESAPNGIIVSSPEGVITMVNRRAEEMFGYTREEFLGLRIDDLVPDRFRGKHGSLRESFHGDPQIRAMGAGRDLYAVGNNGREFPVEIALTPLPEGEETHVLASVIDITERKRSDEALLRYAEDLERSNAELDSFASVASHDLQEPLRKIRTMGGRLVDICEDSLDEKARDYLDRMIKASDNMHRLIRDLLSFSRVETKGQPFAVVALNESLADATSMLELAIEETHAKIEVEALPTIEADEAQMRQLFQNLVGNAIKFRREGVPPEIRISCQSTKLGKEDAIEIRVKDNGIGFDEKYKDRIFEIFQRLHGKNHFEGTGIGLAICKKIVERHRGVISALASPDSGAEFIFSLPTKQPVTREEFHP
ncbi:MAG: ATP-binding protein [Verrucomicrobiota bacterium]